MLLLAGSQIALKSTKMLSHAIAVLPNAASQRISSASKAVMRSTFPAFSASVIRRGVAQFAVGTAEVRAGDGDLVVVLAVVGLLDPQRALWLLPPSPRKNGLSHHTPQSRCWHDDS